METPNRLSYFLDDIPCGNMVEPVYSAVLQQTREMIDPKYAPYGWVLVDVGLPGFDELTGEDVCYHGWHCVQL